MPIVKKLIFAPIFIIVFTILLWQLPALLHSYDLVLSFSLSTILQLIILSSLILLTSLLFVLFASFANDWKFIIPIAILSAIIPMFLLDQAMGLIMAASILASLLIIYVTLENTLKTYVNFEPTSIFGPSIRHLTTLFIIVISFTYFLTISQKIQTEGFQIPNQLIDESLKLIPQKQLPAVSPKTSPSQPSITPEQIELLKKNPQLLEQYGLDPSVLDSISIPQNQENIQPQSVLNETIKQTVKDQLETIVNPYINFIPAALALLLFLILISITSFLTILIYPLLWVLFKILESSGFVKFTEEMRPVKKLVV
ncbi:MAG: hypothetical protein Q8P92_04155 [Candidatus Daviesbacteria bacterium]|nr:hypothetical protein [Candidatus Daviesbacteria bacterium]